VEANFMRAQGADDAASTTGNGRVRRNGGAAFGLRRNVGR